MTSQGSRPRRAKKGASAPAPLPAAEGLTPLDQERAASVADEGGAAAAAVESQEQPDPR